MKAFVRFVITAFLAGLLASCQQAYVDKSAAAAESVPPAATLTAPSVSVSDVSIPTTYTSSGPAIMTPISASTTYAASMAQQVAELVAGYSMGGAPNIGAPRIIPSRAAAPVRAATGTGSTSTGTVVPPPAGYSLSNGSLTPTMSSGELYDPSSNPVGPYTLSTLSYELTLNDYTAALASSGVSKLFKKAVHDVDETDQTDNSISYASTDTIAITGSRTDRYRQESYTDDYLSSDGNSNSSLTYGIVEESVGAVLGVAWNTGDTDSNKNAIVAVGKFVVSVAASSPYTINSSTDSSTGSQTVYYSISVKAYDPSNNLVYTGNNLVNVGSGP